MQRGIGRYRHGMSNTKIHWLWCRIRQRCDKIHCSDYFKYGARGISVCEEWEKSFETFMEWAMSNGYKEGVSIDRINNDGNYCPENCRFTDNKTQSNNRRGNHLITIDGITKTIQQWSDFTGVPRSLIRSKLRRNVTGKDLINNERRVNQHG